MCQRKPLIFEPKNGGFGAFFFFFFFGCTVPGYPGGLLVVLVGVLFFFSFFVSRGDFIVGLLY